MNKSLTWQDILYREFLQSGKVSTDTRSIDPGSIFFALKGSNFNGNEFAAQAVKTGASLVVVDEDVDFESPSLLRVEDSLASLQWLANRYRQDLPGKVVAIGGSNGKTTTKGLVGSVLNQKFSTFSTPGNFNNHIGVPLSILACPRTTEMVVLELGANHGGEHLQLLQISEPDLILITNIGKDHLEGFGGLEGVIKATGEFFDFARDREIPVFFNADQAEFQSISLGDISFGSSSTARYRGEPRTSVEGHLEVVVHDPDFEFRSNLVGAFNFGNLMSAIALGRYLGIPDASISRGIQIFQPEKNRSQIEKIGDLTVFLDCYNANPTSMEASISSFFDDFDSPHFLILGGMKELGRFSESEHQNILKLAQDHNPERLYLVGKEFEFARSGPRVQFFQNLDMLKKKWSDFLPLKGSLLVKGSRSYNLEKLFE